MAKDNKLDDYNITKSISNTVLAISGVSRLMENSIAENLNKFILGKQTISGISLSRDDDDITVSIHVIVVYGVNIPQISYEIQIAVKEMLDKKYKIRPKSINIYVEGVDAIREK